jgi:signal transduction histidine kinase
MSLRLRLVVLTVALAAVMAVVLSAVELQTLVNSISAEAYDRSYFAGQQVKQFLIDHINQHSEEAGAPATLEETRAQWDSIVAIDMHISKMLLDMTALSRSLFEINVAGANGMILISSNPSHEEAPIQRLEELSAWTAKPWYRRAMDLIKRRPDWEVTVPIGIAGQSEPIYTIQVVNSDVFLRDALLPEFNRLLFVSSGALLGTLLLTVVLTTRTLQPLRRIERTIDRIAQGKFGGGEASHHSRAAKEFRAMESKLNLLGRQLRETHPDPIPQGPSPARQDVDLAIEQIATELDVATRLAAISKITSGVAHEIKNPLNAIVLRLDLLRETLLHELGPPGTELVKEIDLVAKEVHRLDRVVKTFLDFSRPVDVRLQFVDLAALAREVAELMAPQGRLAAVEVTHECSAPAIMRGDADLLKQAILNLVTNGLQATPPGGRLHLVTSSGGGRVRFDINDTGPGIPPQLRDKVFQLYFTTKAKGSGIGLAMTYRAVQLHNGLISYTSEEGRGTTFHLEFPAATQHG